MEDAAFACWIEKYVFPLMWFGRDFVLAEEFDTRWDNLDIPFRRKNITNDLRWLTYLVEAIEANEIGKASALKRPYVPTLFVKHTREKTLTMLQTFAHEAEQAGVKLHEEVKLHCVHLPPSPQKNIRSIWHKRGADPHAAIEPKPNKRPRTARGDVS